jgi:xylulokinase
MFVPHFAGRTCPNNPKIRGSWLNMNWSHNRGNMFKSIMESIAYEYHYYIDIIRKSLPDTKIHKIIGVGGGAKSPLFNRIKADVLSCQYQPMERTDAATLACAVMAGYGIGYYDSIEDTILAFVKEGELVYPDNGNSVRYLAMANRYMKVLHDLAAIYS